jgi:phosphohistidine phosphatase SixA
MSDWKHPLPGWIYRQSAALPYRWSDGDLEVLLITNRTGKRWIVPKGIVEPGLSPQASAAKETREEAGVQGTIADLPLGSYRRPKWGGTCEVSVHPLLVSSELSDWAESGFRRRRWVSVADALNLVEENGLRDLIARLPGATPDPTTPPGRLRPPEPPSRLVYLMRHAQAHRGGSGKDIDRALTAEGVAACERLHRYLSMADVDPDIVLCSTALRARQTLDAISPVVGGRAEVAHLQEVYEGNADALAQRLRQTRAEVRRVMVVGHNPALPRLVEKLTGESSLKSSKGFPSPALAILELCDASWLALAEGSCRLHSLVAASDLSPLT